MSGMEVLTIVAAALAVLLIGGHQFTGWQLKRLRREASADEAARSPAE